VTDDGHRGAAARLRALLSAWERNRDLITLGAYREGSDADADAAIARMAAIEAFLRQEGPEPGAGLEATVERLKELVA
jgi:flagellar biosynthesis/type III secretory pathway ATPase